MNTCWCRYFEWWNFSAGVNVSSVRSTVTSCISKNIFWKWRNWLTTADVLFLCLFVDVHGLDVNDKYLIASSSRWIKFLLFLFLLQSQNIFCFVFPFQLPTFRVTQIPWYYCVVVSQGWLIPLLQLCGRWLGVRDWGRGAVRTWWGDNSHQQLSVVSCSSCMWFTCFSGGTLNTRLPSAQFIIQVLTTALDVDESAAENSPCRCQPLLLSVYFFGCSVKI